jgi:RNA polymerase primary sigma factor
MKPGHETFVAEREQEVAHTVDRTRQGHPGEVCLLAQVAKQGFVTYDDVPKALPQADESIEVPEHILATLIEDRVELGVTGLLDKPQVQEDEEPDQDDEAVDLEACFEAIETDDMTALYFKEIDRGPLLTAEQEVSLARRLEAGQTALKRLMSNDLDSEERAELEEAVLDGQSAYDHLIRANFRLVISIAKKYIGRGVPFLDLIQEGNIGLIRAVGKFDYRLGHRFSTYATWWIRQAVTRAISIHSRTIRVPVHLGDKMARMSQVTYQLTQELGRKPTPAELAAALGVPSRRVEEMLRISHVPLSLDVPINDEGEDDFGDLIEDERGIAPDDEVAATMLQEVIREIVQTLPPREARILQLRYGLMNGKPHTLEEVGKKLGVTRERVRQIEAKALRRLRHPVHRRRLRSFVR